MKLNLLSLNATPILDQLKIEEGILRTSRENYCIVNTNAPSSIVLGSSCNEEDWVHLDKAKKANIPLIKRMSSGGTVFIDPDTIFVTFIIQKSATNIQNFPKAILKWAEGIYVEALPLGIKLKDNDFVIGEKKIGGNALFIRQDVWLIHTSFLWDFQPENMDFLKHPKIQPEYRKDRPHLEFITNLAGNISKELFTSSLISYLQKNYTLFHKALPKFPDHRQSVQLLDYTLFKY